MQELLERANAFAVQYASLVNILLTTFVVYLTGWYAFVTRRMWKEMVESRRAAVRPILDIDLGDIMIAHAGAERRRDLSSSARVSNHGRGPAYAVRVRVRLRYESEHKRTWIQTAIDVPTTIAPGNTETSTFKIHAFPTLMDTHREDFLMLEAHCRDAEGNSYVVDQTYDLRAFDLGEVISRTWQLRREDERFAQFSRTVRSTFEDDGGPERMEVLRSRRLPRWRDWSR